MWSLCARALCQCLVFAALVSVVSGRELYVRPNTTAACPGEPCLTLDQYMENSQTYITSNTVFKLLPGQHNTISTFVVQDVVNISIVGRTESTMIQPVIGYSVDSLYFFNATDVLVRGVIMVDIFDYVGGMGLSFQQGSNLVIEDVDIRTHFYRRYLNSGIQIVNAININLTSVTIFSGQNGIYAYNCSYISLSSINVSEYNNFGLQVIKYGQVGFLIEYCNFITVKNMTVSNGRYYGILARTSSHISVLHTVINDTLVGINIDTGSYITAQNISIANNNLKEFEAGILLQRTMYAIVSQTSVYFTLNGVLLEHTNRTTLYYMSANNAERNGICLFNTNHNRIIHTTVNDAGRNGIELSNTRHTTLYHTSVNNTELNGVALFNTRYTKIFNNIVNNARANGTIIINSSHTRLFHSSVNNTNSTGMSLQNAERTTLTNCHVEHSNETGILLYNTSYTTISHTTVNTAGWYGIETCNAFFTTVLNTTVADTGLECFWQCEGDTPFEVTCV